MFDSSIIVSEMNEITKIHEQFIEFYYKINLCKWESNPISRKCIRTLLDQGHHLRVTGSKKPFTVVVSHVDIDTRTSLVRSIRKIIERNKIDNVVVEWEETEEDK